MTTAITLFRKRMGIKGKSQHLGRGFYQCAVTDSGITQEEIYNKAERVGNKMVADGIATMSMEGEYLEIKVLPSVTGDKYYNTIVVHPNHGCMTDTGWGVYM